MPEYIERNKAIKEIRDTYESEYPTASGAFDEFATILVPRILKNLPSSDVVEVVRCKDCKYFTDIDEYGCCYIFDDGTNATCKRNDFCSWGEMKEGAEK
ncbi:MAG: hypothetical protein IJW86_09675 [Clostridia bacterium]|nr:hypothetical protein [Clostridia bacterium]